ncbi:unnamed protein product [Linum trigynum]|uniref:DUF4283 domain-containing protein n=1 Tax=Linum trigynum TaxID=586398 RepID=A0AAV2EUQ9_9ROSI
MIVWVQLPALKVHFYHKEVLTTLGNLIDRGSGWMMNGRRWNTRISQRFALNGPRSAMSLTPFLSCSLPQFRQMDGGPARRQWRLRWRSSRRQIRASDLGC